MNTREVPCSICGDPDSLENYYNNYRSYFNKTRFACEQDAGMSGFKKEESDKGKSEMTKPTIESLAVLRLENTQLKGQVKHLTLKMEAMEIIEKMLHNQIKDLIERHNNLMDVVKQNSKLSEGDSSGVVGRGAKVEPRA